MVKEVDVLILLFSFGLFPQDRLLFQVGARKWWSKPLFSQQSFNSERQKFDRFFQTDKFTCATFYGLTTYQPAPVVVYKQMEDGSVRALRSIALIALF